ncbi:hypothetical protein MNEG_7012 [Monoraphidium neglectum]|uniref:Uncharacterized protein n=1 Tax=Monoraphidium neglectum TaxID=145388 RepID=A0A0D2JP74_9CHLO|nr:hypothetical protein MNEG_7012 [Monoraphidium neglectum]KIZ00948.1 hypothetical protein MNEG_7012 [Monoraphidium neglectum]|eukprot:XP_013899967.1 hypothetical protein MNEG_7012 [Monoraphidium neglectum]
MIIKSSTFRAHIGVDPNSNQIAYLVKEAAAVGELQRSGALALRYASLAAERGVRAAAAALGHAFATGGGVGEGALDGPCPALAVRWLRAALGAQGDGGAGTVADAAAEGVSALSLGYPSVITANIAMARSASSAPGADELSGSGGGAEDDESGSGGGGGGASGTAGASSYNSWGGEVEEGGLEEGALCALRGPSGVGRAASQVETVEQAFALLAEAEAEGLPGGTQAPHELHAELARLLLAGGPGLPPDPAAAAEAYTLAAEAAEAAFKGKLAARFYELAAQAEAAADE